MTNFLRKNVWAQKRVIIKLLNSIFYWLFDYFLWAFGIWKRVASWWPCIVWSSLLGNHFSVSFMWLKYSCKFNSISFSKGNMTKSTETHSILRKPHNVIYFSLLCLLKLNSTLTSPFRTRQYWTINHILTALKNILWTFGPFTSCSPYISNFLS